MIKRFKNIQLRPLLSHLIITLIYPVAKACISERNKLLVFTDALTIAAGILVIGGVIYAMILHGDFDISRFALRRGIDRVYRVRFLRKDTVTNRPASGHGINSEKANAFREYKRAADTEHAESFNYPLFCGIGYLCVALIIAYVFL